MTSKPVPLALVVLVGALISGTGALAAIQSDSSATPVSGTGALNSIACPSAKACVGVGSGHGSAIFDGKSAAINAATGKVKVWSGSLTSDSLNGVACPSRASCLAVSDAAVASVKVSSGAMKVTATPKKPATGILALNQIACSGSKKCYAVGFEGTEAASNSVIVTLSPAGKLLSQRKGTGTGIGGIACPTSSLCLVADHSKSAGETIQLLKNGRLGGSHPLPRGSYVQNVSCFKAELCYALGGSTKGEKTDELFPLNPKTGKPGKTATMTNFSGDGISCFSATSCVISGFVGLGQTAKPATVSVANGKPKSPVTYPAANSANFHDVACASSTKCYAAGSSSSGGIVEKVKP